MREDERGGERGREGDRGGERGREKDSVHKDNYSIDVNK